MGMFQLYRVSMSNTHNVERVWGMHSTCVVGHSPIKAQATNLSVLNKCVNVWYYHMKSLKNLINIYLFLEKKLPRDYKDRLPRILKYGNKMTLTVQIHHMKTQHCMAESYYQSNLNIFSTWSFVYNPAEYVNCPYIHQLEAKKSFLTDHLSALKQ